MRQNEFLHNVSHETIDIPDYLSTIFDWFQTWASYENVTKTTIHSTNSGTSCRSNITRKSVSASYLFLNSTTS